jgi:hypothetical protein
VSDLKSKGRAQRVPAEKTSKNRLIEYTREAKI